MYRQVKSYEESAGAQYITFRTISDKTAEGWMHPGIEARKILQRAGDFAVASMDMTIQEAPIGFEGGK
jgi:hypothetical protein